MNQRHKKWGLNWNNQVYMGTKLRSVQWQLSHMALSCHVTLTLPRVKTGTWHVATQKICKKKIKKLKENLKKLKKRESDTWHAVNGVNYFFLKGTLMHFFKSGNAIDTFFFRRVPNWHPPTKVGTIRVIKPKIYFKCLFTSIF